MKSVEENAYEVSRNDVNKIVIKQKTWTVSLMMRQGFSLSLISSLPGTADSLRPDLLGYCEALQQDLRSRLERSLLC